MTSRHHDIEYIPLDSSSPSDPNAPRRSFASAKYAGHLFLTTVFFAGVLVGGGIGRWATIPSVITNFIPSTVIVEPVQYKPVVTIFDSFVDLYVSTSFLLMNSLTWALAQKPRFPGPVSQLDHDQTR